MNWTQWRTSLSYTMLLVLLAAMGSTLSSFKILDVFQLERFFSRDLELNDLYYQLESWRDDPVIHEVIVVNTESLAEPEDLVKFRSRCGELVRKLNDQGPSVIGVDLVFRELRDSDGPEMQRATGRLKNILEKVSSVIVGAKQGKNVRHLMFNQESAIVNFPQTGRVSIRRYQREFESDGVHTLSFGAALVQRHRPNMLEAQRVPEEFPLRYGRLENLVTHIDARNQDSVIDRHTQGFPVIDAQAFLDAPESFAPWVRGSMVILGEVSGNKFDIEDKHRVPCDSILVNRTPSVSGPIVHAIAAENMLHFSSRGWRYVPEWIRSLLMFLVLLTLVHLLLHTRFGKWANFIVLFAATLPIIFMGIYLMSWGYYWPMTSTLLPLVFIEEIMEVVVPMSKKVRSFVAKRIKWWGAAAGLLMLPVLTQGQSIEFMVLKGSVQCNGLDYSPGYFESFVAYPEDTVTLFDDVQVLMLDSDTKKSTMCTEAGEMDWSKMQQFILGNTPSLGTELIRLFFVDGLAGNDSEQNIGAASRGGGDWRVFPTDGSTVFSDSVWVGFDEEEALPSVEFFIRTTTTGELIKSWMEPGLAGFWWVPPVRNACFDVEMTFGGSSLLKWRFRVEDASSAEREDRLRIALLDQCMDCTPAMRDSLLQALKRLRD